MGWWSEHAAHVALVGVPTLGLAALVVPEILRARPRRQGPSRTVERLAAAALAGAGAAHLAATPGHWSGWPASAAALTLIGVLQLGGALLLARHGTLALLQAAAGGSVVVLTLFLLAHTAGLPGAPTGAEAHRHTGTALVAGGFELAVLALAAAALRRARRTSDSALTPPDVARVPLQRGADDLSPAAPSPASAPPAG